MAGTKGKVGGRSKDAGGGIRTCDFCGNKGSIGETIIRILYGHSVAKTKFMWACKDESVCSR